MIKLTMDTQRLKDAYEIAEREKRTLLGVIYSDYITPKLSNEHIFNPKKVYANRDLVLKMMELDKKLNSEDINIIYLQYGPSTNLEIKPRKDELLVVL